MIQLADGSTQSGIVQGKGNASILLQDKYDQNHNVLLKNCLCIPSYNQNILSVSAATESARCFN